MQAGQLVVGGQDVAQLGGDGLATCRRLSVGFVFQHFGSLDALTALENVELAAVLAGERPSRRRARARELLDAVGMAPRAEHRPAALSGGERQRVAIAGRWSTSPSWCWPTNPRATATRTPRGR